MSNLVDLIIKKRDGLALSAAEIQAFITAVTEDTIADYQTSAMLMAMFLQGLTEEETVSLTQAMTHSGTVMDLSSIPGKKADKHSTGGVADTTTLILAPLVASCGVPVFKMSGRGLGFSGGTLDKLESIPGFSTSLSPEQAISLCKESGLVVMGQTKDLTPADQKLYALRDVTGTVDSIPLIVSSIMSKKIAAGADAIVLDVKCGSGAFMKDLPSAQTLARQMVQIGRSLGRRVSAVISSMAQPLGLLIGNALEVEEAISVLKGETEGDLLDVSLELGSRMLLLTDAVSSVEEGKRLLRRQIETGAGLAQLERLIAQQGGDISILHHPDRLPKAQSSLAVKAPKSGYLCAMDTASIGHTSVLLGAGRVKKTDAIDYAAGIRMAVRLGDFVEEGQLLGTLYARNDGLCAQGAALFTNAFTFSEEKPTQPPLILDIIEEGTK